MPALHIPGSTYRIQFSLGFRFVDGRDLVPYLNDLGITDLYSSPRFKARRGSPHAYDITNPLKINSELGTEEEFHELTMKLRAYNMGLLLDIVPNHMATTAENPWWMDLLENGQSSIYVAHFAVDWGRANAKSQGRPTILLPILGDLYGKVLQNGEISLKLDENGFFAKYWEMRLPLDVKSYRHILCQCLDSAREKQLEYVTRELESQLKTIEDLPASAPDAESAARRHEGKERIKRELWKAYNSTPEFKTQLDEGLIAISGVKGDAKSFDLLDRILNEQHYRVAYWRMAAEELNYRRFFDLTDLIGVRVEDPEVFDARHEEITRIVREEATGVRVDHIDGLWDPAEYLVRLRSKMVGRNNGGDGCTGFYILVEKILGGDEELPRNWAACGTTGYDFLNWLNGLFVDPEGLAQLDEIYRKFSGLEVSMAEVEYTSKKEVMGTLFPGEVRALGYHLARIAAQDRIARDLPYAELVHALVEVTAWLPVYRTYIRDFTVPERDRKYVEGALEAAQNAMPDINPEVFAFLRRVLLMDIPPYVEDRQEWLSFVMSWQQFTGPCMAKGFEDTTCYRYYRLVSHNEVGSRPELADRPAAPEEFHRRNQRRLSDSPSTLNATSTHDTKHSEDVRARINVLSEIPQIWAQRLSKWSRWNAGKKQAVNGEAAPDRNDEFMIYQTLVGIWPLCVEDIPTLRDRMRNYLQKAVREAKRHSSWLDVNEAYESALQCFCDGLLEQSDENVFLKDFIAFQSKIAPAGAVNALAQVLLKICSPGVPDFYQGTELWDFSLVDPDNRRPVDFTKRGQFLDELRRLESHDLAGLLRTLTKNWEDGRIKLYTTCKALNFRRAHAELFLGGEYVPVAGGRHVCAFVRRNGTEWALAAAPRLSFCPGTPRRSLLNPKIWGEEALTLPAGAPRRCRNVFTAEELDISGTLRLADLFAAFPVGLLEGM